VRPTHRYIQCYCHQGRIGVLIEFGLETWLVTQREEFLAFARDLAMHVAASSPESVDGMLSQVFVRDTKQTVGQVLLTTCSDLGERVIVTRFVRWDTDVRPPDPQAPPPRDPAVALRLKRA
jgi:elongation factor Ts